jgi:hypothetical protein
MAIPFRVGDEVVCISNDGNEEYLEIGGVLTIDEIYEDDDDDNCVSLGFREDDNGYMYPIQNFVKIGDPKDIWKREDVRSCIVNIVKTRPRRKENVYK